MSVSFARAVADGLRAHGITVHYAGGWEWRGNGQTSAYDGGIVHHTASGYDMALPGRYIYTLLRDGRSDLSGPLCNSAGNEDGSVTIVAAHPANHAGAAGGSWARPFPNTRNFNRMVWGHEIVYPGNSPMRPAQYHAAQVLGGVVSGILRKPNPEWIRAHYETSVTGKWDPGYAPGKWIDMNAFRAGIWGALHTTAPAAAQEDNDMQLSDTYKDWAGNEQTVEGTWNRWDRKLWAIERALLEPQPSRVPGAEHINVPLTDAVRDTNGVAYQLPGMISGQQATITKLTELLASQQQLDVTAVKNAVAEALAEGTVSVDVSVTSQGGDQA